MKLLRPTQVGQIRIEIKEVMANAKKNRGWSYGHCRTITVYEATAEEVADLVQKAIEKAVEKGGSDVKKI